MAFRSGSRDSCLLYRPRRASVYHGCSLLASTPAPIVVGREFSVGTGRWRGGRPRISSEVRHLIIRMARENSLWGAPRIHGELLMLGFSVSRATVSRYMPARSRRPEQSWRTFLRNQAMAFGHCEYSEEWHSGNAGPQSQSYSAKLERSGATQIATVRVGRKRSFGRAQSTLSNRRIRLRSAECDRGVTHRAAYCVERVKKSAVFNRRGAAFLIRSPSR
jgi:hypothetical protein